MVFGWSALQCCSSVWNSATTHCDVVKIESVQQRFTKYIGAFTYVSYLSTSQCCMLNHYKIATFEV